MRNEFVSTESSEHFFEICEELISPEGTVGPSLAMATGPAGRGKSETAKRYAVQRAAVYVPPLCTRTPAQLLREICFDLAQMRPTRAEHCLSVIGEAMAAERRLILIDEADLLAMQVLEMLRNLNELHACPVVLIGEEGLKGKVESRRRLRSRMRRRMEFRPVSTADISLFFKRNLDREVGPEAARTIHRHAQGDWRPVLTSALAIERALAASGMETITEALAREAIDGG